VGEPILDPGRQAGMCIHDGSEWRKAKGDADGHVHVDVETQPIGIGYVSPVTVDNVPPGSWVTILDITPGKPGELIALGLWVDGGDIPSSFTIGIRLTRDGTELYSGILMYFLGSDLSVGPYTGIYSSVGQMDTAAYRFQFHFSSPIGFQTSLKIEIRNRSDTQNIVHIRGCVLYRLIE